MKTPALDACLALEEAHARLRFKLDDALGTHHGLSWRDFTLLAMLAGDEEGKPLAELGTRLGLQLSDLVRQLVPLEKLGLVRRQGGGSSPRTVALLPGGRRLWNEAVETAEDICAGSIHSLQARAA
jgi:DNA-binding MarR family transcriptional regulator